MSTPQFSLIVVENAFEKSPAKREEERALFTRDVASFFKKFQIPYEILWLGSGPQKISTGQFMKLCDQAQADFIASLNLCLNTPLGDVLKLLQTLITSQQEAIPLAIVFGNSHIKQPQRAEVDLFIKVLKDKNAKVLGDPFSECLALRKSVLPQLQELAEVASPFFAAHLQSMTIRKNLAFAEVSVHDLELSDRPGWLSRIRLKIRKLWFVLTF